MGRWSARLAPRFIDFADIRGARRLLDVGCGTGVLSEAICGLCQGAEVVGADPAEDYVAYARARVGGSRARFHVGDAGHLPFADAAFDVSLGLLVLQEFAEPRSAILEMRRVTRPGGTVATCQWDFASGIPMLSRFWDAVMAVRPEAIAERSAKKRGSSACSSEPELADLWRACGLCKIQTATLEVTLDFSCFEDFWTPFLSRATPGSSYAPALPPDTRQALERELRRSLLGDSTDGPFTLAASAFAVHGKAPAA